MQDAVKRPAQDAAPDAELMHELGGRIRAWRARRGMTRKALALDARLSERFLADVETGRGNVSIHSLAAVARALNVGLVELLQDPMPTPLARVVTQLQRLEADQLEKAWSVLGQQFGFGQVQGRERRIALIGLRGAGKSTLGQQLAASRGVPFVELDREIEREAGTSLNEIFLLHGQPGYRRYERRALLRIAEAHADGVVMTTGGSLVSERETFDALMSSFWCVWVKASPEEHMARVVAQGDMRPMGGNAEAMDDLRRILASREPLYARADAVVDTAARSVAQSLKDLERAVPALG